MKSVLKRMWACFTGLYSARARQLAAEQRAQVIFPATERWIDPSIDPRGL